MKENAIYICSMLCEHEKLMKIVFGKQKRNDQMGHISVDIRISKWISENDV
jgi:hypothetical protein